MAFTILTQTGGLNFLNLSSYVYTSIISVSDGVVVRRAHLMSVHISVRLPFPVGLRALTGRLIKHREEETTALGVCVCV